MPRGTIEERRAYFRARRLRQLCALLLVVLALTHRPYSVSLEAMTNLARGEPDTTIIPNYALGAGTAALLMAALFAAILLWVTRPSNPQALMDQVSLVRLAMWIVLPLGLIGFGLLFVAGVMNGW